MTKEEANKKADLIMAKVEKSSVAQQLKLLYITAQALDILTNDADQRLRYVFSTEGLAAGPNDDLKGLKMYCQKIKEASYWFDRSIGPLIENSTWGAHGGGEFGSKVFDTLRADANAFAQLMVLFMDRSFRDREQSDAIFDLLEKQQSHGLFTKEDVERFRPKYPKLTDEEKVLLHKKY